MTKLDFHCFQVRHFSNNFERSPCYNCKMGATLESRFRSLLTYTIHHQAKYQRLNANALYVAAILFSRSTLHRETLPCLPNTYTTCNDYGKLYLHHYYTIPPREQVSSWLARLTVHFRVPFQTSTVMHLVPILTMIQWSIVQSASVSYVYYDCMSCMHVMHHLMQVLWLTNSSLICWIVTQDSIISS